MVTFLFSTLNISLYSLPACLISEDKSSVILILIPIVLRGFSLSLSLSLWFLSRFLFDFLPFEYKVIGCSCFCLFSIYPIWCSLSFHDLWLGLKILNQYYFKYFFFPLFFFSFEMTSHSSTLAWKIPWMEDPGRLQFMGSQRVRHDWATSLHFTLVSSVYHVFYNYVLVLIVPVLPF